MSFTSDEYVKDLFAKSVGGEYDEYGVSTGNYYRGHWIDHPAQANLYQVPEPLRWRCLQDFLEAGALPVSSIATGNYGDWLTSVFGKTFAETFPKPYTRKYWTTEAENLTTDWMGNRIFRPSKEDIVAGSRGPLPHPTHYITTVRYPRRGGYQSFGKLFAESAHIEFGHAVRSVDLERRTVTCANGAIHRYERLVSTIPLPVFVAACRQATAEVLEAARALSCTQVVLVNVELPHPAKRPENWLYVYDEDKLASRIHFTERLTPGNAPPGHCGIQAEVYFSKYRPQVEATEDVAARVVSELFDMNLISRELHPAAVQSSAARVEWANVIFDHARRPALAVILGWLEQYGLNREVDDVEPTTDWESVSPVSGSIALAGRFGQWKYFWTDDCVLRGKLLAQPVSAR